MAYKVSQADRIIYIADPDFPVEERFISMVNDTFYPYDVFLVFGRN
ncbi:MAG: hypothetical protein GX556_19090 [Fibrobacter sp.]|nr:hypothetical protein [Fibrobacter sp.]